ncbi:hypothetical protein L211DRAFT_845235 [Terfezia boudieri ATCC MYA-4762]|uniref:Uncharacterized protein n=1 Tax=Terfezia boudieri ATCC MYA-4762 TaxID=1051890 RepID=A0A3N4MMP2_9PEZI|nr:hypothetical protein L211DRAFT_845235 [Terfezia boudieri ATCC MYA-4762]
MALEAARSPPSVTVRGVPLRWPNNDWKVAWRSAFPLPSIPIWPDPGDLDVSLNFASMPVRGGAPLLMLTMDCIAARESDKMASISESSILTARHAAWSSPSATVARSPK